MSLALPPAIVAGEIVRLQTRQHVVALTFDGGGNADGARGVLLALRRGHVPATFFLTGHFVQTYPALARVIGRRYPVGNHTVDHLDMLRLSKPAATREVTRAAAMIQRATGRDTHPYFRFPYGSRDARTLRLVHRLGYASVRWTVDTSNLVPGEIVLMHLGSARDRSTIDAKALPTVIRLVRARGYRFVTLAGIKAPARR